MLFYINVGVKNKFLIIYLILCCALVALFVSNIIFGAVSIPFDGVIDILLGNENDALKPSWQYIILESRLPQVITALLGGAALAVSGLMLQTLFRNPLAGPSILGISDGANLGVALVMLYFGGAVALGEHLTVIMAALLGASSILMLVIWFSTRVRSNTMLLIVGIMVGYMVSSVITVLNFKASTDKVHAFVMWGMGNFAGVSMDKLSYFVAFILFGLVASVLIIKPLNALLLGENYAANLGVKIKSIRVLIFLCAGVLTATTTAFCGPISFIGLAVPHIARLMLGTSNHKHLVPVTILSGACIAMFCNLLTVLPGGNQIFPLNAITPIVGAPVIIYVILNRKNIQYFS